MEIFKFFLLYILAYLVGSIPSAVWLGKLFHGKDVREIGSGNAGTMNAIRAFGWPTGIAVFLLDFFKGVLAVMLPVILKMETPYAIQLTNLQVICGTMAIIGHIFPAFADFRGGKGVATIFGIISVLNLHAALICAAIFVVLFILTGVSSISSILAIAAFPIYIYFFTNDPVVTIKVFSIGVAVIVIITHHDNIIRLIKGKENRFFSWGKKKEK